jgi:uncharacterized protein (UPF0333 family)
MSSDINVQTFSGKVNINNNLLVGSSHLFVDTVNNRVGITTADPDAGLHVNSNAYVHTDFRVGSGIVMNDTTGQITAGSFVGDGSAMTGINSDSGSWVNGSSSNIHLAVSTDKVGIGYTNPLGKLYIAADYDHTLQRPSSSSNHYLVLSKTGAQVVDEGPGISFCGSYNASNDYQDVMAEIRGVCDTDGGRRGRLEFWTSSSDGINDVDTQAMTIKSNGNVGIGTTDPTDRLDVHYPTPSYGSGGTEEGSLTVSAGAEYSNAVVYFRTPFDAAAPAKRAIISDGGGFSGGASGGLHFCLEDTNNNTTKVDLTDSKMMVRHDGNVGIGTTSPSTRLHVNHDLHLEASSEAWNTTVGKGLYLRYSLTGGQDAAYIQSIDRSNASLSYPMIFQGSSYEFSVGSMGIGKTPSEKLHVHENLSTSGHQIMARIGGDTSSYNTLVFGSKEGRPHIGGHRGDFGAWADLSFQNDLMILQQSTDRVGIGTSGPSGKLHIYEPTGTSHGVQVGTLILDHGNSGGSSSIVFPSRVNYTSDYAYITYNENYGEAGVSSTENGVLLLGAENDGTGSSDHVRVKTRLVVEADMTSSDPTYAFQVKSSNTTSDLFNVHRGGSIGINGNDSNVPFTINTNKYITVDGTNYNSYCRWYRGSGNWYTGSDNSTDWNQNLYWFANISATGNPLRRVIFFENDQSKGVGVNVNTFTGQHRNIVKDMNPTIIGTHIGLIVSADNNENIKVNGGVERGLKAITINETIPYVSVTTKAYDKQVFGVVSGSEDPDSRQDTYGRVTSVFIKEEGDDRIFINSLGEGAMWISNQNGPLISGDYVTSSHIPGYGMKQDSEFLANYTVAKITMDCDFLITPRIKYKIKTEFKTVDYYRFDTDLLTEKKYNLLDDETKQKYTLEQYEENVNILDEHGQLQWEDSGESEAPYQVRYLLPDGTQISEEEYTTRALADEKVYIAAFVGCTYHCG